MLYATQDDLVPGRLTQEELVQLTDDAGAGQVNAAVVDQALTRASANVESYVRLRYALPLQSSEQIKGLTLDIAVYLLFLRRRRVTEDVERAYKDAIKFLEAVADGRAALDQPAGALPQAGGGGVKATQKEETFSDDKLEGFK